MLVAACGVLLSCLVSMICMWYALGLFWVCGRVLACWYAVCIWCGCLVVCLVSFVCGAESVVSVWKFGTLKLYAPKGWIYYLPRWWGNAYFSMRCRIKNPLFFWHFSYFVKILAVYQLSYIINTIPVYIRALVCEISPYFSQVFI